MPFDRRYVESCTSTQDVARDLPIGSVVVTDFQTGGRGRLDRTWEAAPGTALLASVVLPADPLLTLRFGLGVVLGIEAFGITTRLKWPNDVLLDDRKVCGILAEAAGDRGIVGFGVNLTEAPEDAAKLGDVDRDALLNAILHAHEALGPGWLAGYRSRCGTIGARVRVTLARDSFEGTATAVTDDGALVVDGRAIVAGDVIHVRRA